MFCSRKSRKFAGIANMIELLHCSLCGIVSASRMPLEKTLADFYEQYYSQNFYKERGEVVAVLSPSHLARHIYGCLSTKAKEIENAYSRFRRWGWHRCSIAGESTFWLMDTPERFKVTIVDYNIDSIHRETSGAITVQAETECLESGFEQKRTTLSWQLAPCLNTSSILTLRFWKKLFIRMSPGGFFYARTPYVVPFRKFLALFGITFDFTYPAHLHDMGSLFWNRILTTLNLQSRLFIAEITTFFCWGPIFRQLFFPSPGLTRAESITGSILGDAWPLVGGWEVIIGK